MDDTTDETPSNSPERPGGKGLTWSIIGTLVIIVATIVYVLSISYKPAYGANRNAQGAMTSAAGGQPNTINLNIVTSVGSGPHADWLGYQTQTNNPHPGTVFTVKANSLVTVIVHNFDSRTALRNPFFTLVQGTVGGIEEVNGKPVKVMNPNLTSHTFTIPEFGVSVPMEGVGNNAKPGTYEVMKFTFRVPNKTGVYRWQCIVPCGSGLYGFGGPMQEIGYMDGLITVTG